MLLAIYISVLMLAFHTLVVYALYRLYKSLYLKCNWCICYICFLPVSLTDVKSSFSIGARSSAFG